MAEGAGEPRPGDCVPRGAGGRAAAPPACERERSRKEAARAASRQSWERPREARRSPASTAGTGLLGRREGSRACRRWLGCSLSRRRRRAWRARRREASDVLLLVPVEADEVDDEARRRCALAVARPAEWRRRRWAGGGAPEEPAARARADRVLVRRACPPRRPAAAGAPWAEPVPGSAGADGPAAGVAPWWPGAGAGRPPSRASVDASARSSLRMRSSRSAW